MQLCNGTHKNHLLLFLLLPILRSGKFKEGNQVFQGEQVLKKSCHPFHPSGEKADTGLFHDKLLRYSFIGSIVYKDNILSQYSVSIYPFHIFKIFQAFLCLNIFNAFSTQDILSYLKQNCKRLIKMQNFNSLHLLSVSVGDNEHFHC